MHINPIARVTGVNLNSWTTSMRNAFLVNMLMHKTWQRRLINLILTTYDWWVCLWIAFSRRRVCLSWWDGGTFVPILFSFGARRMVSCYGYILYKRISNYILSPAVHAVYTRMNSPLPWLNTYFCVPVTCVCGCPCILNCVYVLKCRNTMWLGSITCAWLARLSVSMCPCLSETCVLILSAWAFWLYCSDVLSCLDLRLKTCSK